MLLLSGRGESLIRMVRADKPIEVEKHQRCVKSCARFNTVNMF